MVRQGTPGHSDKTTETICDTVGANSLLPPYAFHAESEEHNDYLVGNAILGVPKICTAYIKTVGFGVPDEPIRRRRII